MADFFRFLAGQTLVPVVAMIIFLAFSLVFFAARLAPYGVLFMALFLGALGLFLWY